MDLDRLCKRMDRIEALMGIDEAEREEWVEIDPPYVGYRIRRDGTHPQERDVSLCYEHDKPVGHYGAWDSAADMEDWVRAYRKGREVGLSERLICHNCVKLAEARELVEAVKGAVDNPRVDPQTQRNVRYFAKKLEAKL